MTYDRDTIKTRIMASNAWVARALWVLCDGLGTIRLDTPEQVQQAKDDQVFFKSLREFFKDNGFFTDRHIAIARNKIRDEYLDYLVMAANC